MRAASRKQSLARKKLFQYLIFNIFHVAGWIPLENTKKFLVLRCFQGRWKEASGTIWVKTIQYIVWMRENTGQKNSEYRHLTCSDTFDVWSSDNKVHFFKRKDEHNSLVKILIILCKSQKLKNFFIFSIS